MRFYRCRAWLHSVKAGQWITKQTCSTTLLSYFRKFKSNG